MSEKPKIAVVAGGYSSEREISLRSGGVVFKHLDPNEFDKYFIDLDESGWYLVDGSKRIAEIDRSNFSFSGPNGPIFFDAAFIAVHGTPGEDGKLQSYFDLIGLPYNTCGAFGAAITFEKGVCNQLLRQHNIPVARSILLEHISDAKPKGLIEELGLPLFIKPSKAGSSYGISKAKSIEDITPAIINAFEYDDLVVVEEELVGREVTCGVFKNDGKITALPVTEIISDNEFFDYQAKYEGASREITPADIVPEAQKEVQNLSQRIYKILRLKGTCRMDYILHHGKAHLIEVNTVPGLSEASIIPQQVQQFGLDLRTYFGNELKAAIERRK